MLPELVRVPLFSASSSDGGGAGHSDEVILLTGATSRRVRPLRSHAPRLKPAASGPSSRSGRFLLPCSSAAGSTTRRRTLALPLLALAVVVALLVDDRSSLLSWSSFVALDAFARPSSTGRLRRTLGPPPKRVLRTSRSAAHVVSDESVPEAHLGLHNTLYAEGSEVAHEASSLGTGWPGRLDGSELLEAGAWTRAVQAASGSELQLAVGLFALYQHSTDVVPFMVGLSRRVQADVARHTAAGETKYVRVKLLGVLPQMWTREMLEEERRIWAQELGFVIGEEKGSTPLEASNGREMDPEELRSHEERKWKLQLAMGQNLHDGAEGEAEQDLARRERFLRAVEGDDWSEVIGDQAAATLAESPAAIAAATPRAASPFQRGGGGGPTVAAGAISRKLTVANVQAVLEAVRPILVADGGDIEVLGVNSDRGAVMLGLMGACSTCPAAPETMESGVEKALFEHFGRDVLKEVVRVDQGAAEASPEGVRKRLEAHLLELEASLAVEGGEARVTECHAQGCTVELLGPSLLRKLVEASLRHRFPELRLEFKTLAPTSSA